MKHIRDVIPTISIPISTNKGVTSTEADTPKCPICRDAGYLRVDVPIGHPNFGRIFPCECKVRELEQRQLSELHRLSNLDAFEHLTFRTFDASVPGVGDSYRAALDFARDPHGWLFLHGNCGCGKTHLAVAIAQHVRKKGSNVLFTVVPDLLDHLRATFDPAKGVAYDERFNVIRSAYLLILDDLGTENTTPWAREKLYQLINHRYNEHLPTVITSNQDFKLIDERILSRLLDTRLNRYVFVDASDYRRRARSNGSSRR